MINKIFTIYLLSIILCISSLAGSGQSISGNVNSGFSSKNLVYANVDIYKNGKLVANVLTDGEGNFNVKLDTGVYQCEINYAGYKKITKEIKVTKDEKSDFSLAADDKAKYTVYEMDAYMELNNKYRSSVGGVLATYAWGVNEKSNSTSDSADFGKLTAGEINDFCKWDLWTDLTEGELKTNQQYWNFAPTDRYTVQLKDKNGLPLANAKVELMNGNEVIYTSRSDNTGKAELWGTLESNIKTKISSASISVNYNGESKTIKDVKKFDKGINNLVFNGECEQPQNVDIAIVVDATGSMQDEIDYLKSDLNDVIYKSKEFSNTLNLRFANVFYRDKGDAYITESQDFTRVLSESIAFTNKHSADGGGDEQESVEIALDTAINGLSWGTDTRAKILFLVLDASPHCTPEIQKKMRDLCYQAAEKGIRIVPITGSGSNKNNEYLMRCLALATNGTYTFLTNHSGIGNSHINPSTDNYQVEILNDLLVRIIKSYTYMPDCKQYVADLGVNLPDSQVVVLNNIDSTTIDTVKSNSTMPVNTRDSIDFQWKFYPNPTNGIINIISSKEIKEIYISDLSGKVLQIISNITPDKVVTADLSEYSSGIYLVRYPIGKQWISGKIILVR